MTTIQRSTWFFWLGVVYTGGSLVWFGALGIGFLAQPLAADPAFNSVGVRWLIALGVVPAGLVLAWRVVRRSPGNVIGLALVPWTVVVMGATLRLDSPLAPYAKALNPGVAGPWRLGLCFPDDRTLPGRWLPALSAALRTRR